MQEAYDKGFEKRYEAVCAKRRSNQNERAKRRVEREKLEMDKTLESVDPEKFNRFQWCKKIARNDLSRLYASGAEGMLDTELLDEVGFAFYARCKQVHDARENMEKGLNEYIMFATNSRKHT